MKGTQSKISILIHEFDHQCKDNLYFFDKLVIVTDVTPSNQSIISFSITERKLIEIIFLINKQPYSECNRPNLPRPVNKIKPKKIIKQSSLQPKINLIISPNTRSPTQRIRNPSLSYCWPPLLPLPSSSAARATPHARSSTHTRDHAVRTPAHIRTCKTTEQQRNKGRPKQQHTQKQMKKNSTTN
ncbi:hypothetical protein V6Z11_D12G012400 [Gossypium hirsutum]